MVVFRYCVFNLLHYLISETLNAYKMNIFPVRSCSDKNSFLTFNLHDSISDDSLQEAEINMESVSDYSGSVQEEKMEEQTEILHNGFNPEEENCGNCDRELNEKPQDTAEETTLCPVIPKRAALLYPLK